MEGTEAEEGVGALREEEKASRKSGSSQGLRENPKGVVSWIPRTSISKKRELSASELLPKGLEGFDETWQW